MRQDRTPVHLLAVPVALASRRPLRLLPVRARRPLAAEVLQRLVVSFFRVHSFILTTTFTTSLELDDIYIAISSVIDRFPYQVPRGFQKALGDTKPYIQIFSISSASRGGAFNRRGLAQRQRSSPHCTAHRFPGLPTLLEHRTSTTDDRLAWSLTETRRSTMPWRPSTPCLPCRLPLPAMLWTTTT